MSDQIEMEAEGIDSPQPVDTRLSYSSQSLLTNCQQRYVYYKVDKVDKDKDAAARDDSHFAIGKSFHYILEVSNHEKPAKIGALLEYCVQNEGLKEEDTALVHGMVLQYLRLRKDSGWTAVKCEHSIKDPAVIGFIDLIEKKEDGSWCISDMKTAATFYPNKIAELPSNVQLNLYASFYKEIAKEYDLDPKKFLGCRYLVTTKSKAKQQAKESYNDFVMRLVNKKHVKSHNIFIPKALMRIEATRKEFMNDYKTSLKLRSGKLKPTKNYTYCNAFFKGCDYFSRCHGQEYSEFLDSNKIIVESTK